MSLKPVVLVDLLGLKKLSSAFGIALLFQGIGATAGPPLAGLYELRISKRNELVSPEFLDVPLGVGG